MAPFSFSAAAGTIALHFLAAAVTPNVAASSSYARETTYLNTTIDINLSDHKMIMRNARSPSSDTSPGDMQPTHRLIARATSTYTPCSGCANPSNVNNKAFFALFAILGVAMVATIIWFFFHAKNGGFHYQEGDWEDYKSTVLRRKGPDGKTLSNASRSTKLGGGSVVAIHDRLLAKSIVGYDEKGRKGIRAKRGFGGSHSVLYSDDFSNYSGSHAGDTITDAASRPDRHRYANDEKRAEEGRYHTSRYRDRDVHHYRKEAPARVGGMNRPADGSSHDFSDTATQITNSTDRSTANLIRKDPNAEEREERKRAKAERKALEDAKLMERKWRREAEAAARAIAREGAAAPIVPPQQASRRERRASSSGAPRKRDYSFSRGQDEVSTAASGSGVGSSYYDEYRPRNEKRRVSGSRQRGSSKGGYRRYAESEAATSDSGTRVYEHKLGKGQVKEKKRGGRDVMAGYRRGRGGDSEDEL